MINPGVEFKSVEGDALSAYRDLGEIWADFGVEAVAIHAEVARGVSEAKQPWLERRGRDIVSVHAASVDRGTVQ